MAILYKSIKFEPDSEHEPVDMFKCVSYFKHLQKLVRSFTIDFSQNNSNA